MRNGLSRTAVLNEALAEVRTVRRMARFWTVVLVLSFCSLIGYFSSCVLYSYSATSSPSFGPGTPKYLLGNVEPTFFLMFQLAALCLVFDAAHRHRRNRIDEVIDSKPVHNYEYLAGRVIGIAGLVWFVAAVLVITMQAMGFVSQTLNIGVADTFQFHSLLNLLLLDAPVTLLVWTALVASLSCLVRARIFVLAVSLIAMFSWYFLVLNTPFDLLSLVSPASNDSLFVSELVPEFASWQIVTVRFATVLACIGLIATGALVLRRNDSGNRFSMATASSLSLVLGVLMFALVGTVTFTGLKKYNGWAESHEFYEWNGGIDVNEMKGEIFINPGKRLTIDLDLNLSVSGQPEPMVFTLNPGMNIQELSVDGVEATYTHRNGLLEVKFPSSIASLSTHTLNVVAIGVPNPRFAYLDSAVDYLSDSSTSRQAIMLLGKDGSVFDTEYVALMPGSYWYPVPGPARADYLYTQTGFDYFDVDLLINLQARDWRPVGTGTTVKSTQNGQSFQLTSSNPIHEVGLFASNFASASLQVNETTFAMYLHKRHSENIRLLQEMKASLRSSVEEWFQVSNELGFSLPTKALTFVEVPRRLRTVGGGWRMNSVQALPGVFLLKEHAFPTARMDLALARIEQTESLTETEIQSEKIAKISGYFNHGIGTDNPWSSLSDLLWTHSTTASGEYSHELHQVMLCLLLEMRRVEHYFQPHFFNMHSLLHFADLTRVSLFEGSLALMDGMDNQPVTGSISATLALRELYPGRLSVWDSVEQTSFTDFPTLHGNKQDLELLLLKASLIANSLLALNGTQKIAEWMAALRKQSSASTYTLEDAIQLAGQYDVVIDPFLTSWLRGNAMPGYLASSFTSVRIEDDAEGNPQYQTSVNVRNTQPVSGLVRLEYPSARTAYSDFPYMAESIESTGVRIEGNSAIRINLITRYDIRRLYLDPGPSLNRTPIELVPTHSSPNDQIQLKLRPFLEASTWSPMSEDGIIVDDLDSEFSVNQPRLHVSRRTNIGPLGWLRRPVLEAEIDRGIPLVSTDYLTGTSQTYLSRYRSPPGAWARTSEPGAFGRFRKTTALTSIRDTPVQATFMASIPQSARWKLEYHAPKTMSGAYWNQETTYLLSVEDKEQSWDVELDAVDLIHGWNLVGEFELDRGMVSVELACSTRGATMYADAVRWTKTTKQ